MDDVDGKCELCGEENAKFKDDISGGTGKSFMRVVLCEDCYRSDKYEPYDWGDKGAPEINVISEKGGSPIEIKDEDMLEENKEVTRLLDKGYEAVMEVKEEYRNILLHDKELHKQVISRKMAIVKRDDKGFLKQIDLFSWLRQGKFGFIKLALARAGRKSGFVKPPTM